MDGNIPVASAGLQARQLAGLTAGRTPGAVFRFAALDGVRGVAAVLVVLYHLQANGLFLANALTRNGALFVDCFFVLSGFVIASSYQEAIGDGRDVLRFMMRRFGRVWPLHAAVLAVMASFHLARLAAGLANGHPSNPFVGDHSLGGLAASLLLVHSMGLYDDVVWNPPSWSISVEFYAYLLFALVVLLARRWSALVAVILVLASAAVLIGDGSYLGAPLPLRFFRCTYGFFTGMLGYAIFLRLHDRLQAIGKVALTALQWTVWGGSVAGVAVFGMGVASMLLPLLFAAGIVLIATNRGGLVALLSTRPFDLLGNLSYGIYMVHIPVLNMMFRGFPKVLSIAGAGSGSMLASPAVFTVIYLSIVVVVAWASFRWLEIPARNAVSRAASRLFPRQERETASA